MSFRPAHWCLLAVSGLAMLSCIEKSNPTKSDGTAPSSKAASYVPPPQGVGTVEGTVLVAGDPALVIGADEQKIPQDCDEARKMYPPLFREGPGRTLADAFVGVTGYKGDARPKTGPVSVEAKGCAFSARTYAIQDGQHFLVRSTDSRTVSPSLFGTRSKVSLLAVGKGEAVPVFHKGPGQYVIYDEMQIFTQSTALVMSYPTFDVTGLDGKFRVTDVPAGAADVSVFLPAASLTTTQKINVERGKTTQVTLTIHFDAEAFKRARQSRNQPGAAAGTGAPPATATSAAPAASH